jgi:hypothetical protein
MENVKTPELQAAFEFYPPLKNKTVALRSTYLLKKSLLQAMW